ncbi:hypothetical protein [Bosea sp. (in: a-proteobacteria)]|uniref:hypothetical protein n=1 Tax=Bosea sp. (in: a-proteobacteria) TaxID=1871050 RepID=UPI00403323D3
MDTSQPPKVKDLGENREKGKEKGNYLGEKELRKGRGRELKGAGERPREAEKP